MKILLRVFVATLLLIILFFAYIELIAGFESKHIIFPYIDTEFAQGFNKEEFYKIKEGMSVLEVESILGQPLSYSIVNNNRSQYVDWNTLEGRWSNFINYVWSQYSHDGKWKYGDFAWEGYSIKYDSLGFVIETQQQWYYD